MKRVRRNHWTVRLVRVLSQSPLPVSTPDLVVLVGATGANARRVVWSCLRSLRRAGWVDCRVVTRDVDTAGHLRRGRPVRACVRPRLMRVWWLTGEEEA